jgi:hypothetical protein
MANKSAGNQPQQEVEMVMPTTVEELQALIAKMQQPQLDVQALVAAIKGDDKGNKHQAHGLTQNQIKAIHKAQQSGEVEMIPANLNSKFKIPAHETKFIHFTTEKLNYKEDGEKISRPRMHVKDITDFERMSKTVKAQGDIANPENAFAGMKVIIYHDPRKTPAQIEAAKANRSKVSREDALKSMNDEGLRNVYFEVFGEEPLPSDSKTIIIQMITDRWLEEQPQ